MVLNKHPLSRAIQSANTGLDAIKRAPIVDRDTGIKCLRIQDISQKKTYIDWGFTEVRDDNFEKFKLLKDDILIARTGASIGVNRFISENVSAVFNNGLIRIRIDKTNYYPEFIYYLIQSDSFKEHINAIAFSTSAQPNMKIKDLLRFEFTDLPLSEQKAIAHILGSLDNKIELNRRMNATLEGLAQALFQSWFVDFDPVLDNALAAGNPIPDELTDRAAVRRQALDNGTANREAAQHFPDTFQFTEELGWIPAGWEKQSMIDQVSLTMGQSPPSKYYNTEGDGLPFHQGVTNYGERFPKHVQYSTGGNRYAEKGDILFSVRAPVGRINISDRQIIIGRGLSSLRHKKNYQSFLVYFLKYVFQQEDSIGSGTIFNAVNKKDMERLPFLLPTDALSKNFDDIASSVDEKIASNASQIETLTQLRDTLLPQLISGELQIPDAEKLTEDALV